MLKMSLPYLWIILTLIVSACSPQYQLVHDYDPPTHSKGKDCINQQCSKNRSLCQKSCNKNFQNCLIDQEKNARNNYPILLDDYYHDLELYQSNLELYHQKLNNYHLKKDIIELKINNALEHCKKRKIDNKHCPDYPMYQKKMKKLHRPYQPNQPVKPSLAHSINHFQQSCSNNCLCDDLFNQCYIGCGGKIQTRKICINNCD